MSAATVAAGAGALSCATGGPSATTLSRRVEPWAILSKPCSRGSGKPSLRPSVSTSWPHHTHFHGRRCPEGLAWTRVKSSLSQDEVTVEDSAAGSETEGALVGEDAAAFALESQSASSWGYFFAVLFTVLTALYFLWLDPSIGIGGGFIDSIESLTGNSEVAMLGILLVFAVAHSGLAGLRAQGEELIGPRAYRVLFGVVSLPLAVAAVAFFINHRYDGLQLWQVRTVPGVHELVWILSFISFFFLYPSTFNLLEVAAVDRPKVHLWETGIIRITRHPQMVGQLIWCLAHILWIGNSFMITTSLGLCAHHAFGVWHGDRRLKAKYGDAFEAVKARTSVVPFQAIWEGRQKLPDEYYKEFLRMPYIAITIFTVGAYLSHPLMQQASFYLHW